MGWSMFRKWDWVCGLETHGYHKWQCSLWGVWYNYPKEVFDDGETCTS